MKNKIKCDILNKRVDSSKLTDIWKEFKEDTWDFQRHFFNDTDVYINTLDVGTALFFKRAFNLTEIEGDKFKPKPSNNSTEYNLKTIKYIITLAEGIGNGIAKIESSNGCLTIECDNRVIFIVTPTSKNEEIEEISLPNDEKINDEKKYTPIDEIIIGV